MKSDQPLLKVQAIAQTQGLVISEKQCREAGFRQSRIMRLVDRGLWRRLLPGVYFTSNGDLQWFSRLHAALLYAGDGAAISHESAAFVHGMSLKIPKTITMTIPEPRRVAKQHGLRIQRRRTVPRAVGTPPIVTAAETLVDLFDTDLNMSDALGYLTSAIRKRVRPADVLNALSKRKRHKNRHLLRALLNDSTNGIESPLEYYFVRDVEEAHGLPCSRKQAPKNLGGRWIRSDCHYEQFHLRVELDGQIAHPGGRTNADTWRDNAVAIQENELTLRYRWHHVLITPCQTARQVGAALQKRGWRGTLKRCGEHCRV